jgi:alkaline phosphatase
MKLKMKKLLFLSIIFLSLVFLISCSNTSKPQTAKKAKYVFLFIGDGMGYSHIALTEAYLANLEDEIGVKKLVMSEFPVHGVCNTFCETRQITGSAAAGTAIATGKKTGVGIISKSSDRTLDYKSLAYKLKESGYKIGIISNVAINHATPATFYANADKRSMYYEIGVQLPTSGFDFFGGGGFHYPEGRSNDMKNLYDYTHEYGYNIYRNVLDFDNSICEIPCMFVNSILLNEAEMPFAIDPNYKKSVSLSDFLGTAINSLNSEDGFFIMLESGKIDWAGHGNDAGGIIHEMLEFDKAIAKAYEFYLEHPDETLIIVSSDHETGGLSLGNAVNEYQSDFKFLQNQKYSQSYIEKEIYNFMNNSPEFSELLLVIDTLCFNNTINFSDNELSKLKLAYDYSTSGITNLNNEALYEIYGGYHPVVSALFNIINTRAGVGFNTWSHTAVPVPVMAIGAGSKQFDNYFDNTEISKKILDAMGF